MAISRVQSTTNSTATSTTIVTATLGSTPVAGNILVVALAFLGDGTSSPDARVSFQGTNMTFHGVTISGQGASNTSVCIGIGRVRASPGSAVQATSASAGGLAIAVAEYSGLTMNLDREANATTTSASPNVASGNTTANANQLWIGAVAHRLTSGVTFSAPTNGFSIVGQNKSTIGTTSDRSVCLLEKIVSATGTPSFQVTASASGVWVAQVIALEEATASGSTLPVIGSGGLVF